MFYRNPPPVLIRGLPYDLFCPSVQDCLHDRICTVCDMYFASQVMLKIHICQHRQLTVHQVPLALSTHVRVAARRQRDLMIVIALAENSEHVEWVDEECLDLSGLAIPNEVGSDGSIMPIITLDEHFSSPWDIEASQSVIIP